MDTKSRKSTKLAKVLIALCVMLPAVILVSLYPTMEKAMLEKRAYYEELEEQERASNGEWLLEDNFENYALEASYYIYAQLQNQVETEKLDHNVFEQYGWDNDYLYVRNNTFYNAVYTSMDGAAIGESNADELDDSVARFTLAFDSYGNITECKLIEVQKIGESDDNHIYESIQHSVSQFENNLVHYNDTYETEFSAESYMPKNFRIDFALNEHSNFIWSYDDWYGHNMYDTSTERLYYEIGVYWIIIIAFVWIFIAAMTLPAFKGLNTGREKIFSISFEVMLVIALFTIAGAVLMGEAMTHITLYEVKESWNPDGYNFIGTTITAATGYDILRVLNFFGWSIVFFLAYTLCSNIRQFFGDTKAYLKYQVLSVRFFRWIKKKIIDGYHYVTNIDLNEKLDKSIIKIVLANFVILTVLCCLWLFGVAGLIIYSIVIYVIIKKQAQKIQKQYHSVLRATEQMAEGNLDIKLEEELGIFEPVGKSLEKVQQGFDKAVKEEAKSQNMKTELITNVSHDLKTPLTAIITYVDLLKKADITEEERKQYIQTLDQKSQRLKVLIEDLFEVSKAHSGNVTMNYMDVDVVSLLKQVKSEMDDQIQASDLDFKWNIVSEKVILSLDGQRTYRVFENLINNALKYSLPHSRVYVSLSEEQEDVKIVFRNISAQELDFDPERLTDRFVRGDSSRNSEGSGLGLAIAKSFVELQKGTFKIEVDDDIFKVIITWKK